MPVSSQLGLLLDACHYDNKTVIAGTEFTPEGSAGCLALLSQCPRLPFLFRPWQLETRLQAILNARLNLPRSQQIIARSKCIDLTVGGVGFFSTDGT